MHVHTNDVVISQSSSIANSKNLPSIISREMMTGRALLMNPKGRNASRDDLVKLWEGGFYHLQYYYFVK